MARRGRPPHPDVLTPREWEVLALLREGRSNEEIAERLEISVAGAKYHVSEILGKLGVESREEAARWAASRGRAWWTAGLAPFGLLWRKASSGLLAAAVAASVAVLVAAGGGLLAWGLLRTSETSSSVVVPTATVVPAGTVGTACPGGPTAPVSTTPTFAYAAPDGTIWVVDADGANATQLICSATDARNAAWSASGRYLGHVGEDGALRILNVETGHDTVVDDGTEGSVLSASVPPSSYLQWSPVEDTLIYEKFDTADTRLPVGFWKVTPGSPPFALVESRDLLGLAGWSPDGQRIAYQLRSPDFATPSTSRANQIFIARADGSDGYKLTDGILGNWSPDGRMLAYWKDDHGGSSTIGDIYITDVDSGRELSLGEFTSDERPGWSPDPNRHVFYNLEIDRDALSATPLFDRPSAIINWSPDGTKVTYIEGPAFGGVPRSLVLLELVGGQTTTLHRSNAFTAHALGSGYGGVWSADSRYYAYSAVESTTDAGVVVLYVFDTQSGATNRVLQGTVNFPIATAYSPDGRKLLVQEGFPGSPSVWVADANGSGLTKLADGLALRRGGHWSAWRPSAQ